MNSSMMGSIISSVLIIQMVLQICGACPAGFMSRGGKCERCKTVICSPGEGYKLCEGSMIKDICFKCPTGTYNRDPIDTAKLDFQVDVCAPTDCSCEHDGAIIVNYDSCEKGEEKICKCDRQNLFYGGDHFTCQKMEDRRMISRIKIPGNELTNTGEVKRCQKGYYKTTADLSICKPHTRCPTESGLQVKIEGTAISDALCENMTDVPSSREITSSPPTDRDEIITHNVTLPSEESPEEASGKSAYLYEILIPIVCFILVIYSILAYRYPVYCPCLRSLIEKLKRTHPLRNEPDTYREDFPEPLGGIYEDIDQNGTDQERIQNRPNDEYADSSEHDDDLPSYVRNESAVRPRTLGNLDSHGQNGSETSLLNTFQSSGLHFDSFDDDGRPIQSVAPCPRPLRQESSDPVTQPFIASPTEEDQGELVVGGQRVRDPAPVFEQQDSGLGEF